MQDVAVVRVHDDWDPRGASRKTAEEPGLCSVRMDDGRPPGTEGAMESKERTEVGQRRDLASEPGQPLTCHALLRREIEHVAFPRRLPPNDEARLVAQRLETGAQENHVHRRSPDVQAGEDAYYTYASGAVVHLLDPQPFSCRSQLSSVSSAQIWGERSAAALPWRAMRAATGSGRRYS